MRIGITMFATSELTTAANARPMTNATASSMRLPLIRKSLNSLSTEAMPSSQVGPGILSQMQGLHVR